MSDSKSDQTERDIINLVVESDTDRRNVYISSLLFSRAIVFYPSDKLTPKMKEKQIEIASSGGTDLKNPLGSVIIPSYDKKNYLIELYVDYMLQGHRDILDTLLAYGTKISLDDKSFNNGDKLDWNSIYATVDGIEPRSGSNGYQTISDSSTVVISMSMFDLAKKMGRSTHKNVYDNLLNKITQLFSAYVTVSELDEDNDYLERKPLRFIQDYRFCYNSKMNKNKKGNDTNSVNHIFVILDPSLLISIRDHGCWLREEQQFMSNYTKPLLRNFLKYVLTHTQEFISKKKLNCAIEMYIKSIPLPVGSAFKKNLVNCLLEESIQRKLYMDFGISFYEDNHNEIYILRQNMEPSEHLERA